jgi:hypothetical protein
MNFVKTNYLVKSILLISLLVAFSIDNAWMGFMFIIFGIMISFLEVLYRKSLKKFWKIIFCFLSYIWIALSAVHICLIYQRNNRMPEILIGKYAKDSNGASNFEIAGLRVFYLISYVLLLLSFSASLYSIFSDASTFYYIKGKARETFNSLLYRNQSTDEKSKMETPLPQSPQKSKRASDLESVGLGLNPLHISKDLEGDAMTMSTEDREFELDFKKEEEEFYERFSRKPESRAISDIPSMYTENYQRRTIHSIASHFK